MNTIGISSNSGDWDKHFKLMADIDLGVYTGTQYNVIGPWPSFSGTFDGNGHTISNFTYYDPGAWYIGLFGHLDDNSEVRNLGLISPNVDVGDESDLYGGGFLTGALAGGCSGTISGCYVEGGSISGNTEIGGLVGESMGGTIIDCYTTCSVFVFVANAGGLVGMNDQDSTIISCHSSSDVTAEQYSLAGGLVGQNHGHITDCYATGTVTGGEYSTGGLVGGNLHSSSLISGSYATGNVFGEWAVGGLAGDNDSGVVFDCYATGQVSGTEAVGGLIGYTGRVTGQDMAVVSRCYATGRVLGIAEKGGLVGYRTDTTVTSCFWDKNTSGRSSGVGDGSQSGVTGKTTAQMKNQNTFVSAGWDFVEETANGIDDIWTICNWATYPEFAWQVSPAGSVYYVEGSNGDDNNDGLSLETAFATIQKGIDTAWHDNTIIVLPGTYIENINIGAKCLTLRSFDPNHPEATIIDGGGLGSVVTFVGSENADCRLTGFTITNGFANAINANVSGGGIRGDLSGPHTQATVTNCIIRDNVARRHAGGIQGVDGLIDRCIIYGNSTVKQNGGGLSACHGTISNCLIYDNTATLNGGGMAYCIGDIVNCTIANNTAGVSGGGMVWCGSATITNCIIWGNNLEQIDEGAPTYSCIQDWSGDGTGNITTDPEFADPNNEDYHLLAESPCIDAGDPNHAAAPGATGLDGNPRILDGDNDGEAVVDMGAYETVGPAMVEVEMKFTPQALNPGSQGNWVKAHLVLAEGFGVGDVDADTPAKIGQLGIESEYMNVFINEEGLVEIEAAFRRGDFCAGVDFGPAELTVTSRLIDERYLYGTDTIRIITNKLGYVADLASYWLGADCGPPDWCGGLDVDQDSIVDWLDFAMSDGCCIKIIKE